MRTWTKWVGFLPMLILALVGPLLVPDPPKEAVGPPAAVPSIAKIPATPPTTARDPVVPGPRSLSRYNERGLIESIHCSDGMVHFGYDRLDNLAWVKDPTGRRDYTYDAFGRSHRISLKRGHVKHMQYSYDPWGQVTRLSVLDEREKHEYSVAFEYDILGQIRTVSDGYGRVSYEYRPKKGEIVRTLPNGIRTTIVRSPLGVLSSIQHRDNAGKLLKRYDYKYDVKKSRVKATETSANGSSVSTFVVGSDGALRKLQSDPTASATERVATPKALRFLWDCFGSVIARNTDAGIVDYITAPFGKNSCLVAEISPGGELSRVFVKTNWLSLEHSPNPGTTYYLERVFPDHSAALQTRTETGRSVEATVLASGRDTSTGRHARVAMPTKTPDAIFVSGMNSYGSNISRTIERNVGKNIVSVTTSCGDLFGGSMGRQLGSHPAGRATIFVADALRAITNYALAGPASKLGTPELASGFAARDIRNAIRNNPGCKKLFAHSNGATSVYNCRRMIADLKIAGQTNISEIVIGGSGLARQLQRYFDQRGVDIKVYDASARGRSADFARDILTTPSFQLSGEVFASFTTDGWMQQHIGGVLKVGRVIGGCIDKVQGKDTLGLDAHAIDNINWKDPFPVASLQAEEHLGGIKLAAAATGELELGQIEGAVYDPRTKRIVLVCDGAPTLPAVKPEHLAVAILCVLGQRGRDPAFSLDPADPKKPDDRWMKAVYYLPRSLHRTDFARVMYEADWVLKQYSFGVVVKPGKWLPPDQKTASASDCDGVETWYSGKSRMFNLQPRRSKVAGFRDLVEMSLAQPFGKGNERQTRCRMWIVSDSMSLRRVANAFRFDRVVMRVKAKRQVIGRDGTLEDVDVEEPLANEFARKFTELYDKLALESPALAEVRELAKAVALAKWLKEKGIQLDLSWARQMASRPVDVVGRVTSLIVHRKRKKVIPMPDGTRTEIKQVTLIGGVDLAVKPKILKDDGRVARLEKAVLAKLATTDLPVFTVRDGTRKLRAVVLPVTTSSRDMWRARKQLREVKSNGITYALDEKGQVQQAADEFGNRAKFTWEGGHIFAMDWTSPAGYRALARKTRGGGTTLEVQTPTGHKFTYEYEVSGLLKRVLVDGTPMASCAYDKDGREVTVKYEGGRYSEKATHDSKGRLTQYSRIIATRGSDRLPQQVDFKWNAEGKVAAVNVEGLGQTELQYDRWGISETTGLGGKWVYQRDAGGRLAGVEGPEGTSLRLPDTTEAEGLSWAILALRGHAMRITHWRGWIVRAEGLDGTVTGIASPPQKKATTIFIRENGKDAEVCFDLAGTASWKKLPANWDKAGTPFDSDGSIAAELADFWAKNVPKSASGLVLLAHNGRSLAIAGKLRALLSQISAGKEPVAVSDNPTRAIPNLRKQQVQNIAVYLVLGPSNAAQRDVLTRGGPKQGERLSLHDAPSTFEEIIPGKDETILIVSHTDNTLTDRLLSAAKNRQLENKRLILLTCGTPTLSEFNRKLIADHGVTGTCSSTRPIDPKLVPVLQTQINALLQTEPNMKFTDLMDKAKKRAIKIEQGKSDPDLDMIQKLEALDWLLQAMNDDLPRPGPNALALARSPSGYFRRTPVSTIICPPHRRNIPTIAGRITAIAV